MAGIRLIHAGDAMLAPSITRRVIEQFAAQSRPPIADSSGLNTLTPRELEVLRLVARGLSNMEIAQSIYIGEGTVKTHVARLLMKLDLRDRLQAAVYAYDSGLVKPGAR